MSVGSRETSTIVLDEYFATEHEAFLESLRGVRSSQILASFADRWKRDPRPWAREQILKYLALPLDCPSHHPLVKRLFKHAEQIRDHELLAAFVVAFDRLIRRRRRSRYQYDFQNRTYINIEELYSPRDQIPPQLIPSKLRKPNQRKTASRNNYVRVPKFGKLFSHATRHYLRRRAHRYFRRLGFQQPADYPKAVVIALAIYRDEDFARGENILDNWSLMHIAFRTSPILKFGRQQVEVVSGGGLGDLIAAPQFDELWKQTESADVLLQLLGKAQSRLVRVWSKQLLQREHAEFLKTVSADQILQLLENEDEEVQQFGAGLLRELSGSENWPIATWMKLLETNNVEALATITEVMAQRVHRDRLSLQQCVELTCARMTPVARMGLEWLSGLKVTTAADRTALTGLAMARCESVGMDVAKFALAQLGTSAHYHVDVVSPFFDSRNTEVRRGAWAWLTPESPGYQDPVLWCRMIETPYDDIRLNLVEALRQRTRDDDQGSPLSHQEMGPVWLSILLGVHRGGRAKLTALREITSALSDHPDSAEQLLPVLKVAIRSVRPTEAKAGLSAILTAVQSRPELESLLAEQLPELRISRQEATR